MSIRPTHPDALEARLMITDGTFSSKCKQIFIDTMSQINNLKDNQLQLILDEDHCLAFPFTEIVEI